MEIDEKDKQRELEEIEEVRKRLGDSAVEPEEEPMVCGDISFDICLSILIQERKKK